MQRKKTSYKPSVATPKKDPKTAKLYLEIGKEGVETNYNHWLRSWMEHKIGDFPVELQTSLRNQERFRYDEAALLAELEESPERPINREQWRPTEEQQAEIDGTVANRRDVLRDRMFAEWQLERINTNAGIRHSNSIKRERLKVIISKGGTNREDKIASLFAKIIADMEVDSQQKVTSWIRPDHLKLSEDEPEFDLVANNIEEARELGDFLFLFEAAEATHLSINVYDDESFNEQNRHDQEQKLRRMKHVAGDFQAWEMDWMDQLRHCQNIQCEFSEATMKNIFMGCINNRIFATTISHWKDLSMRETLYGGTFMSLKEKVDRQYAAALKDFMLAKIIAEVIRGKTGFMPKEVSLKTEESAADSKKDNSCNICGRVGHFWRQCEFFAEGRCKRESVEIAKKELEKRAKQSKKDKKSSSASETKPEKALKCVCAAIPGTSISRSEIFNESTVAAKALDINVEMCLQAGVPPGYIDFVYDTGTERGLCSEEQREVLQGVEASPTALQGATGQQLVISEEAGDSIFGYTRVLKNRKGSSFLISDYSIGELWYQLKDPEDNDHWTLSGKRGSRAEGQVYHFWRDPERYGDVLLHCTMPIKRAKSFYSVGRTSEAASSESGPQKSAEWALVSKEKRFYDPVSPAAVSASEADTIARVQEFHRRHGHASFDSMTRMVRADPSAVSVTEKDIKLWMERVGRHCSGCLEGGMREHDRVPSTKPLSASAPGEMGVADIMFIEGRNNTKEPFLVYCDVNTKCLMGVPMNGRAEKDCLDAIKILADIHKVAGRTMRGLYFDREAAIASMTDSIRALGIQVYLKAAGQKVGLAEVSIRIIRVKARSTKAGVAAAVEQRTSARHNLDCKSPAEGGICEEPDRVI